MPTIQRIEFVEKTTGPWLEMDDETAFQIRTDRPRVWLQRLCAWILLRLKCYRTKEVQEVRYTTVSRRKVTDEIARQWESIRTEGSLDMPKRLLLGPAQWAELCESSPRWEPTSLQVEMLLGFNGGRFKQSVEVDVVPHMDGVLLLTGPTPRHILDREYTRLAHCEGD